MTTDEVIAQADARPDDDYTREEIAIVREIGRRAMAAVKQGNEAGIVWHGTHLLMRAGRRRAHLLLGKYAAAIKV